MDSMSAAHRAGAVARERQNGRRPARRAAASLAPIIAVMRRIHAGRSITSG
jgi:hypothetical protein